MTKDNENTPSHEAEAELSSSNASLPKSARSEMPKVLVSQYVEQKPLLDQVLVEIRKVIQRQLAKRGDRNLVRATIRDARVKTIGSLWAKARTHGWQPEEILAKADDILGLRIVCNNLEDVERAKDLVLSAPELTLVEDSAENYFANPRNSYRAFHFIVAYHAKPPDKVQKIPVKCEIQLRTYLSDAWGRLSHQDFYKQASEVPGHLRKLLQRLGDLLSVADGIAQDIREQVSQPRSVLDKPDTEFVTPDVLAFIYERVFQAAPPEYVVRIVAETCKELNVTRADVLDRKLGDTAFIKKLKSAYVAEHGLELSDEDAFQLVPIAVATGDQAATDKARRNAREEWEEIDQIYRSELMSSWLPETYDQFIESFCESKDSWGQSEAMVYDLAEAFRASHECSFCGTRIVDEEFLTENIAEHYEMEDKTQEIRDKIVNSGAETGAWDDSHLCSYCAHVLDRDE